ncbi:MAG: short chain dehydrogenase, partial [Burkholderiales bacterium PBB3]
MAFGGKIAVVTGAGSGMGEATAQLLAARGATVVLAGRSEERLRAAADRIKADGGKAVIRATDVTVRTDLEGLMDWIGQEFGRLDLAVNNAGGHADFKPLHETPADESDWVFDLNLKSVYNGMRAQIALMLRGGGGAIVNNAS